MIQLYPPNKASIDIQPIKNGELTDIDYDFSGIFFLVKLKMKDDYATYYKTLPYGHASKYPMHFSTDRLFTESVQNTPFWFKKPLLGIFNSLNENDLEIYKEKLRPTGKRVILLNCLDTCYGHVFWKMLNSSRHLKHDPDLGLILIIPENFTWLVPEGVAELWVIKGKLNQLGGRISNLDGFIKREKERFDQVYLSKAFVHLDHQSTDFKKYHKTTKFRLKNFAAQQPCITFNLREDRFWLPNKLDEFLFKVGVKMNWQQTFKPYFILKQNRLINSMANKLNKLLPGIQLYATGLGNSGKLMPIINDRREKRPDNDTEFEWCEIYAKSHIVVGVHGSNMLIPTSLSAGFIDILPDYKIDNLVEDVAFSGSSRDSLFLGRILSATATPGLVVKHLVSMINIYPQLYQNAKPEE